jgi:hypothetical protein
MAANRINVLHNEIVQHMRLVLKKTGRGGGEEERVLLHLRRDGTLATRLSAEENQRD